MSSSARAANLQGSERLLLNIHSDELTPAPAPEAERDGAKPIHVRHATHEIRPGRRVIIRSTGKASFLVDYEGHALRVHAQQIRPVESEVVR